MRGKNSFMWKNGMADGRAFSSAVGVSSAGSSTRGNEICPECLTGNSPNQQQPPCLGLEDEPHLHPLFPAPSEPVACAEHVSRNNGALVVQ